MCIAAGARTPLPAAVAGEVVVVFVLLEAHIVDIALDAVSSQHVAEERAKPGHQWKAQHLLALAARADEHDEGAQGADVLDELIHDEVQGSMGVERERGKIGV